MNTENIVFQEDTPEVQMTKHLREVKVEKSVFEKDWKERGIEILSNSSNAFDRAAYELKCFYDLYRKSKQCDEYSEKAKKLETLVNKFKGFRSKILQDWQTEGQRPSGYDKEKPIEEARALFAELERLTPSLGF